MIRKEAIKQMTVKNFSGLVGSLRGGVGGAAIGGLAGGLTGAFRKPGVDEEGNKKSRLLNIGKGALAGTAIGGGIGAIGGNIHGKNNNKLHDAVRKHFNQNHPTQISGDILTFGK